MLLRVSGLPANWRGKSITAMPETPEIVDSARTPESHDAVVWGVAQHIGTQAWSEGAQPVWSARVSLSDLRSGTPVSLPWVLASGGKSLRTVATIEGVWKLRRALADKGDIDALKAVVEALRVHKTNHALLSALK